MDILKGESSPHPTPSAGGMVEAIMATWKALAHHGEDCEQCGEAVAELRKVPDDWLPFYDRCCKEGQELFGAWADARQGMVEQFKDPTTRRGGGLTRAGDSFGNMMLTLQQRRIRLGMVGLDPPAAHLRALALEELPTEAFQKLLAVQDDEARERQIMALEAAQRRHHVMVELYPSGISSLDNRTMYRWRCACGAEAEEDYMDAETAKAHWGRHAGWLAEPSSSPRREIRKCEGCDQENHTRGRFHSRACRLRWEAEEGTDGRT